MSVWPENEAALVLFTRMSTQWRMGPAGPAGLDYPVAFHLLGRMGLTDDEYDATFAALRVVEEVALDHIHKKRR